MTAPHIARSPDARGHVLMVGTFVDNLLVSKVAPLTAMGLTVSWLVDHPTTRGRKSGFSYPDVAGLRYEVVPGRLQRILGRNLGKWVWLSILSFRRTYHAYFSFYIWPHGLMVWGANLLHGFRLSCVHFLIAGANELRARPDSPSGIRRFTWCAASLEAMLRSVLKTFTRVAAKGTHSEAYLHTHGITRTHIVRGSVDTQRFTPDPSVNQDIDLLTVGRINAGKNIACFVRMVRALATQRPGVVAWIVGAQADGQTNDFSPDEDRIRALIAEYGLSGHIRLAPFCADVESLYRRARVYVQTSFSEGLSTSLREAMACGVPAVATDVGDTSDLVGPGKAGTLVADPHADEAFAAAAAELLDDASTRTHLGRVGRELVLREHSVEAECHVYRQLLTDLGIRAAPPTDAPTQ